MTINVVCRRDAINRNRLAPLALVFTHDRRRKFVGLGISEALVHWDFDKQQPTADCPDRAEIQFQITSKIREYERKIKKLEVLEIPVTFDTLFEQNGKRINCTVGEYFKQIIERLEKVEKYSSASKHKVTLVLVSQFRSVNMRFDELDLTYLREFEIFLSQKGNVNNSCNYAAFQYCRLYLIEILHQTTTHCKCIQFTLCCILSKFYIKPQLHWIRVYIIYVVSYRNSTSNHNRVPNHLYLQELYLIEILHQTTTSTMVNLKCFLLYLIEILHQTTTLYGILFLQVSCILSKFYIKPQRQGRTLSLGIVVSYRNSTSNHNTPAAVLGSSGLYLIEILHQTTTLWASHLNELALYLIEILHQTTTLGCQFRFICKLYLIEILHQTTTRITSMMSLHQLYLIEILHQTTTLGSSFVTADVLYLIEILHQTTTALVSALSLLGLYLIEILHQTTTASIDFSTPEKLYLIEILHQTTTFGPTSTRFASCILSKFYIKPQHLHETYCAYHVVSYRNSTSNHNGR